MSETLNLMLKNMGFSPLDKLDKMFNVVVGEDNVTVFKDKKLDIYIAITYGRSLQINELSTEEVTILNEYLQRSKLPD